jgi:aminoglycoside 3-N-acetyltransferase
VPGGSFVALGRHAEELVAAQDRERHYGPGGPLGKLAELHGWVLLLGVDFRSATSVHCAEDQADLPYLRRDPPGRYLVGPGQWLEVGSDYGCGEGFNAVGEVLRDRGRLRAGGIGAARSLLERHNHIVEAGLSLLAKDRGALLCGQEQCAWCSRARRVLAEEGQLPQYQ